MTNISFLNKGKILRWSNVDMVWYS